MSAGWQAPLTASAFNRLYTDQTIFSMPAVVVTGPTVQQDSPFLPYGGDRSHSQYSLLPTHGGMAEAEWTWMPRSVPRWFTRPKTVTHPGTIRKRTVYKTLRWSVRAILGQRK